MELQPIALNVVAFSIFFADFAVSFLAFVAMLLSVPDSSGRNQSYGPLSFRFTFPFFLITFFGMPVSILVGIII